MLLTGRTPVATSSEASQISFDDFLIYREFEKARSAHSTKPAICYPLLLLKVGGDSRPIRGRVTFEQDTEVRQA
jgi:hypothetical protein